MRPLRAVVVLSLTLVASRAAAVGEVITDVRIVDNVRTQDDTVRSIAGISIGDVLEPNTLDLVRERLNTSGLFAEVNVYWEPHGEGVRVNIIVKDKFPWAPLPTFSRAPGNTSFGLLFVHGNLFGKGKQLLVGGRISSADSGATLVYKDPSLFGTWLYWQVQGRFQDQIIPEFDPADEVAKAPLRETQVRSFGFEGNVGIAWFRRVKTQVGWHIEDFDARWSRIAPGLGLPNERAAEGKTVGFGMANLIFDFRAREHALMIGNALTLGIQYANPTWKSDVVFWKAGATYEQGVRFFQRVNSILRGGVLAGENLPLWYENSAGGSNLRGYVFQQFRGDTHLFVQTEYHVPIISIGALDIRALAFFDSAALWYRNLPPADPADPSRYLARSDGRRFLPSPYVTQGFDVSRDVHNDVGGGIRFFLQSVAVPLIGVDYGYGIESGQWRFFLVIGA